MKKLLITTLFLSAGANADVVYSDDMNASIELATMVTKICLEQRAANKDDSICAQAPKLFNIVASNMEVVTECKLRSGCEIIGNPNLDGAIALHKLAQKTLR